MVQHLLLALAAAPLLVLGRPLIAMLWSMPLSGRRAVARAWDGSGGAHLRRALRSPLLVWTAFVGIFVFWHMPGPYGWALADDRIHAFEHAAMLAAGLAFWSLVFDGGTLRRIAHGRMLLFTTTAAAASAFPGILMILAARPLYPEHAAGVARFGMTLLYDQQLAGLIMWIPAGTIYIATVCWLFLRWLDAAETRARRQAANAALLLVLIALHAMPRPASAAETSYQPRIGDPSQGARLIAQLGCGGCHTVPGIAGADGNVGPPLERMGRRVFIVGLIRNSPENLAAWLLDPQRFVPGNAMPDLGITPDQAADIAAYLGTLR